MISSFARSLHVTPPVIMGRQLRPFSAYHALTLEAFGSPFHDSSREPTAADALEAWLICQNGYRDGLASFHKLDNSRMWRWWIRQRLRAYGWGNLVRAIRAHISSYSFLPRVSVKSGSKFTRAPMPWHVVVVMVSKGLDFAEAMDMPLCQLLCLKVALGELEGLDIVERDVNEALEAAQHPEQQNTGMLKNFFQSVGAPHGS